MAITLQELVVKIQGDVADLKSAMHEGTETVRSSAAIMTDIMKTMSKDSQKEMGVFKEAMTTALGVFSAEGVLHAIEHIGEAIKEYIVDSFKEAIAASAAYEQAEMRMNIALANTGQLSQEASTSMAEFAEKMMQTTGATASAVLGAAAYIEMLTRMGRGDVEQATHAAVELAAVLNIDLQSAAHLVTRALDGNVTQLSRLGIQMDVGTSKTENLKNLIGALGNNMGVAEALTQTYSGALMVNHAQHEAVFEAIGKVFTENQAVIGVINTVTRMYQENSAEITKNLQHYKELVAEGIVFAAAAMQVFVQVLDVATRATRVMWDVMHPGIKTFKDIGDAITGDSKLGHLADLFDKAGKAAALGYAQIASGAHVATLANQGTTDSAKQLNDADQKLFDEGQKIYQAELKKDPKVKYTKDLAALNEYHKHAKGLDTEYDQAKRQLDTDLTKAIQSEGDKRVDRLEQDNERMRKMDSTKYADDIAENQLMIDALLASDQVSADEKIKITEKEEETKKRIRDQNTNAAIGIMGNLVTVGKAMGKDAFEFTKQASAAEAVIKSYQAFNVALASAPPPLNFILAGTAVAAGLANVATIESTHLATGLDTVPGVGFGDSFPAMLEPGEGVTDKGTNSDMKAFFSGGGANGMAQAIQALGDKFDKLAAAVMATPTTVVVGGKTISDTLRSEIRLGRKIYA